MPVAHRRLAEICQATYDPTVPAAFSYQDIKVTLTKDSNVLVSAWRGTRILSLEDWARNLDPEHVYYGGLGLVPRGWLHGVLSVLEPWAAALESSSLDKENSGHSLGAVLAAQTSGIMALRNRLFLETTIFAPPKWADAPAIELYRQKIPGTSYRLDLDPVPEFGLGEHERPLTHKGVVELADVANPLRDHEIARYAAAMPVAG
jgi:hypothetical protein